jgi:hypothetical protein
MCLDGAFEKAPPFLHHIKDNAPLLREVLADPRHHALFKNVGS